MMTKAHPFVASLLLVLASAAHAAPPAASPATSPASPLVDGEVRKVDKEQGKLTLRHGPIPNLEMGGMTMVFRVTDPKWLDGLKEGDKLSFTADRVNGVFTVTSIAPKAP